ncbi:MAG: hypothetical protein ABIV43_03780 [Candidatus Saccharimonadales bacterium]
MAIPKKYVHDHLVLLLLSSNFFLALLTVILMVVRLSTSHGTGYIVQYRSTLGINDFKTGSLSELLAFLVFAVLVVAIHTTLSIRAYPIHRQVAIAILGLGTMLLVFGLVISNALLVLR